MTGARHFPNVKRTALDIENPRIKKPGFRADFLASDDLQIRYDCEARKTMPHVVKFSGGRSSGMMLMLLLQSGLLDPDRGDVVIFNNTSAEHPNTYEFVRRCKTITERDFGVPFFIVEHCTYEDARQGEYTRQQTFRLVNAEPFSAGNPDGYKWSGEVYEELLSWKGFVPTSFNRTCTQSLKVEVTRLFLKEWFAAVSGTSRKGHYGNASRIGSDDLYRRHRKSGGTVPRDIFLKKRAFVRGQPHFRPAQAWASFSPAYKPFTLNHDGGDYISFIGLRSDEKLRVDRVIARAKVSSDKNSSCGEHIHMPLFDAGISREDVTAFWSRQGWDLELDDVDSLSNCTFCFLKGVKNLARVRKHFDGSFHDSWHDTPCDINWWVRIEEKYARDLDAENRDTRVDVPDDMIGFFGAKSGFFYRSLLKEGDADTLAEDYPDMPLPCDCTD